MRKRATERGLTLVEVSVVVVIIGILAVIAVVSYRRHIAAARTAEATNIITFIRKGQEAHKAETGLYANVSLNLSSFYPNAAPGPKLTQWGGPCSNCAGGDPNAWEKINVNAAGPVIFGYATVALVGNTRPPVPSFSGPSALTASAALDEQSATVGPTEPSFVAIAEADANGDGVKCHVLGVSHSNIMLVDNEGE